MSRIAIRLLALGLPALWSTGTGLTAPAPEVDPFAIDASWPLTKGTVWVYEARVEWQDDKGEHTRKLGWRSEVLETTSHKDVAAARLRGDPSDLAWFEEGRQPRVHIIFRVGAARYHRLIDDKAEEAWLLLRAGEMEELQALLTEDNIELELPLVRDKIIGRPNLMTARRYCDLVTNSITFPASPIKGWTGPATLGGHTICCRTSPGHSERDFVQGLGFTRFVYEHHGTPGDVEALLVEIIPAPPRANDQAGKPQTRAGRLQAVSEPTGGPLDSGRVGDSRSVDIGAGRKLVVRFVPGGTFMMGSPEGEAGRQREERQAETNLGSHFWMAETELTRGQWQAVMGSVPGADGEQAVATDDSGPDHPVGRVDWTQAQEFVRTLGQCSRLPDGWKWSLPTEAQWERACRGGTTTATSFGESLSSTQANFNGGEPYGGALPGVKLGKSCPVGNYPANPYGLFDMHGNVWEWCLDGYQWRLPGGLDPVLTDSDRRVIRGGSWSVNGDSCRAAMRGRCEPGQSEADVGLRPIITRVK